MGTLLRRASSTVLAAALLAGCASRTPDPQDPPPWQSGDPVFEQPDSPDILGVNYHPMWREMDAGRRAAVLDELQSAGVRWVRVDVAWATLQPNGPGPLDAAGTAEVDMRLGEIRARGMNTLMMLYWAPQWATGTPDRNGRPRDPMDFARGATTITQRFSDQIDALELWNEPDLPRFWASEPAETRTSDFATMVSVTAREVAASSPDLPLIVGAASAPLIPWYLEVLEATGDELDGIAVHSYPSPSDLGPDAEADGSPWRMAHVQALAMALADHGHREPLWVTEFGWSTHPTAPSAPNWERGVSEDFQATYMLDALANFSHVPEIAAAFWYTDIDTRTGNEHQDHFGMLRGDLSRKPAYYAWKCASTSICGP